LVSAVARSARKHLLDLEANGGPRLKKDRKLKAQIGIYEGE
jgi:hypothetical protein